MSDWTTEEGRKRLRALLDTPVVPDGACVFRIGDMREVFDALTEAEERRDDALKDYARVLAEKHAIECVAERFVRAGGIDLESWSAIQARMAREQGELLRQIEAVARAHGYDAAEGEESVPEWVARICRERDEARAERDGLRRTLSEAQNSGDGSYRP